MNDVLMCRTRVKICGLTREKDVAAAVAAGADAIGFVLWSGSRRAVPPDMLESLVRRLPPFVTRVGLFVDAGPQQVKQCLPWLDVLQFHGNESPAECASYGKPWFKALRMKEGINLYAEAERFADASALLLDAWVPGQPGGTGLQFDWQRVPGDLPLPIVLAGGLDSDNVAEAIRQVRPYAVDVSGGVEALPGRKNHMAMQVFTHAVRCADVGGLPY